MNASCRELKAAVKVEHNLDASKFQWLWTKYVYGVNDQRHCTNCLRGRYGKLLSKHNPELNAMPSIVLDEQPFQSFEFVYICGVIKKGYPRSNYPHNFHAVIRPVTGGQDDFRFQNWRLQVTNGVFEPIPTDLELPERYRYLPPNFTTCRIFRWAVCSSLNLAVTEP